jgi:hypothetical membrane protein
MEMSALRNIDTCGAVISGWWRGRAAKKTLISAAVAAVVLYVIGDVLSALLYDGYSYLDQAISELSAFGSPVRPLMVTVILTHNLLLLAFGIGLLRVARPRSALWWIGALQVAMFVLVGIPTHTFWAMSSRDMATGFNDTMHITSSMVFSILVLAMMVLSAVAYPGWFRFYTLATMVVVVGFGMASSLAIRGIEQNDTPWAGGFERINAYAYFAWLVILAVMVIRQELGSSREGSQDGGSRPEVPTPA